jgi:hypothetical protein
MATWEFQDDNGHWKETVFSEKLEIKYKDYVAGQFHHLSHFVL